MNLDFIPDWVLDWKTCLFWGLGCFGLAFWLLLFGIYRTLVKLKNLSERIATRIEAILILGEK